MSNIHRSHAIDMVRRTSQTEEPEVSISVSHHQEDSHDHGDGEEEEEEGAFVAADGRVYQSRLHKLLSYSPQFASPSTTPAASTTPVRSTRESTVDRSRTSSPVDSTTIPKILRPSSVLDLKDTLQIDVKNEAKVSYTQKCPLKVNYC